MREVECWQNCRHTGERRPTGRAGAHTHPVSELALTWKVEAMLSAPENGAEDVNSCWHQALARAWRP